MSRCIPRAYICLGFRCILYRVKQALCHHLMFSLRSKGSYSRHPWLQTEHCVYVLHRHILYPMLRCRAHYLRLLLRLIQILCCHKQYELHTQTVFRVLLTNIPLSGSVVDTVFSVVPPPAGFCGSLSSSSSSMGFFPNFSRSAFTSLRSCPE